MKESLYWKRVHHRDARAVAMADHHYSRQTPGSPEFTRPGNKIVLLHFSATGVPVALWASQRPDPTSGIKRADGLDAWDCCMYRNEGSCIPSSLLIREAVAITKGLWWSVPPADGFVTTVDKGKIIPIEEDGKVLYGYCFLRARWKYAGITKVRKLVILQYSLEKLKRVEALACERLPRALKYQPSFDFEEED